MKYIKSFESTENLSEDEDEFRAMILHKLAGLMSNIRGSSKALSKIQLPEEVLNMKEHPLSTLNVKQYIEILQRDSQAITDILSEMKSKLD